MKNLMFLFTLLITLPAFSDQALCIRHVDEILAARKLGTFSNPKVKKIVTKAGSIEFLPRHLKERAGFDLKFDQVLSFDDVHDLQNGKSITAVVLKSKTGAKSLRFDSECKIFDINILTGNESVILDRHLCSDLLKDQKLALSKHRTRIGKKSALPMVQAQCASYRGKWTDADYSPYTLENIEPDSNTTH